MYIFYNVTDLLLRLQEEMQDGEKAEHWNVSSLALN